MPIRGRRRCSSQAAFIALARRRQSLAGNRCIASWLHHAAWCAAIDLARSRRTRRAREGGSLGASTVAAAPAPEAEEAGDRSALVDDALTGLHERYRTPIILHHLEERSHEEGARLLKIPVGTFAGRLSRGRRLLERRLCGLLLERGRPQLPGVRVPQKDPRPRVMALIASWASGGGPDARTVEVLTDRLRGTANGRRGQPGDKRARRQEGGRAHGGGGRLRQMGNGRHPALADRTVWLPAAATGFAGISTRRGDGRSRSKLGAPFEPEHVTARTDSDRLGTCVRTTSFAPASGQRHGRYRDHHRRTPALRPGARHPAPRHHRDGDPRALRPLLWRGREHPRREGLNFCIYRDSDAGGLLDQPAGIPVEIGTLFDQPFADRAGLIGGSIPGGRVAHATLWGDYSGLPALHRRIDAWCLAHGEAESPVRWEIYGHMFDDMSKVRTDVYVLLKDAKPGM